MRLRGLLKLVTSLAVVVPTGISVVACSNAADTKRNLDTITELSGVTFSLDSNKKYNALNSTIAQASQFSSKPITKFEVKYYASANSQTEITNNNQQAGQVWIVIIALESDGNWKGETSDSNRISININAGKTSLDTTITTLTGLNISVDISQDYSTLNNAINNANEFKSNPLANGFSVDWFTAASGGNNINGQKQAAGTVYVVITAATDDPYWTGSTSDTARLAVTINKMNLDSITELHGLNIDDTPTDQYNKLDAVIATADEFTVAKGGQVLKAGYSIDWYAAPSGGSPINNTNQQIGIVYVDITAATDDPYWTGSTSDTQRIAITIGEVNLDSIKHLTGLNLQIDPADKYSDFDAEIANANEFNSNPLKAGYTVKWYDAVTAGNEISGNSQQAGDVYVVVTAANDDPYWTGSTSDTTRIKLTINKINLSTITTLTGLNILANPSQTYSQLNAQIAGADEFTAHNLTAGYTIDWYAAASGGSNINSQNQVGGTVYVVISAAGADPYWTGSTSNTTRIAVDLTTFSPVTGTVGSITSLAAANDGTIYAGSSNGTVYKKTSAGTSFTAMTGTTGSITAVAVDNKGNVFAANNAGQVKIAPNGSTTFSQSATGIAGNITSITTSENTSEAQELIFLGSDNGGIYISISGITGYGRESGSSGSITHITGARSVNTNLNCYGSSTDGNVYFFKEGAASFIATTGITGTVTAMTSDKAGNAFAATSTGQIFKASLNSATFGSISTTITEAINSITVQDNNTIWVGTISGHVYKSTDNGATFKLLKGVTGPKVNALVHDSNNNIFAGSDNGVFEGK